MCALKHILLDMLWLIYTQRWRDIISQVCLERKQLKLHRASLHYCPVIREVEMGCYILTRHTRPDFYGEEEVFALGVIMLIALYPACVLMSPPDEMNPVPNSDEQTSGGCVYLYNHVVIRVALLRGCFNYKLASRWASLEHIPMK